ncbi:MAG: hypothetical protein WDA65_07540 [Christensenellales bacterium]
MNKTETKPAVPESERLRGFLQSASAQLYEGEDKKGIENLLAAVSELEKLVESDQGSPQPRIDLDRLLPLMKTLRDCIKNQDIAGIADLLEDKFYPMAAEWMKKGGSI